MAGPGGQPAYHIAEAIRQSPHGELKRSERRKHANSLIIIAFRYLDNTTMRLLRVATLTLTETHPQDVPPYAIISHVWGNEEVTLQDLQSGTGTTKAGYDKIKGACSVAASCGLQYVWLDTCCIDKTSSAELSEAINSMYRWYCEAKVCFAYLSDVSFEVDHWHRIMNTDTNSPFATSRWFTRGWTLQELIAPSIVIFLDHEWNIIGTKSEAHIQALVSLTTGIPRSILIGESHVATATVAQRMSWASKRETTRIEDRAYSLLGIFDIHMPLLYGEGSRAFIRLQEEIMRASTDSSIFAWWHLGFSPERVVHDGLLATSPTAFTRAPCQLPDINIISLSTFLFPGAGPGPFTVDSKGIHFSTYFQDIGGGEGLAVLDCTVQGSEDACLAVRIRDTSFTKTDFVRVPGAPLQFVDLRSVRTLPRLNLCVKGSVSHTSTAAWTGVEDLPRLDREGAIVRKLEARIRLILEHRDGSPHRRFLYCTLCPQTFLQNCELDEHVARLHPDRPSKALSCFQCQMTFSTRMKWRVRIFPYRMLC